MPYGEKSKEQLIEYSSKAFKFFEKQNVKAVIMACNTTSAIVYEELKDKYNFKLYPLIQSVSKIFAQLPITCIGVFATPATIKSHAYSKWINHYNPNIKVIEIDCPEWVKFVENNEINTERTTASVTDKMAEMQKFNPQKIILGCTHYPYLADQLSKHAKAEIFINPAKAYAEYIKADLSALNLLKQTDQKGCDKFFVSLSPDKFTEAGKRFYNVTEATQIDL